MAVNLVDDLDALVAEPAGDRGDRDASGQGGGDDVIDRASARRVRQVIPAPRAAPALQLHQLAHEGQAVRCPRHTLVAITGPGAKRPAAEPLPGRHRQPAHTAPARLHRHEVKLTGRSDGVPLKAWTHRITDERHLRRTLAEYIDRSNSHRLHPTLQQKPPAGRGHPPALVHPRSGCCGGTGSAPRSTNMPRSHQVTQFPAHPRATAAALRLNPQRPAATASTE